ncbi:MAG: 23S rRNA (uracil(1939)-C(5))-methyltransferase RlmD [Desulfotignum sp.]|nr:23S rRNA (uracil(1939)-C(5))-methyltransferase RlmD [Desulfotignum sp.]MCF8087324.1 23S rRNA (uracil(1939)-C(5))-methyltransferase RlmD [Desulfotignum sp.]MCF8136728.1 23S rRNA (uracil(1939)-C(5))-methyltransferase RlmD [Desulfotignum sp.]
MSIKKRRVCELEIIDLAYGGKGLAKPDGFPVFVDRCVPGDRVQVKISKKKKSWAEARLIQILSPSSLRQTPRCRYADFCGGCKWQSIPYETQLDYKKQHVVQSLAHIGGLAHVPVLDVIPSDPVFEYRNKMEFSCSARRWLMPEELADETISKDLGIGLHVPGTFDQVIDIHHCDIMPEQGNAILDHVRQFIRSSDLPAYHLRHHTGFWRYVMLRHSVAFDQWMVNIVTRDKNLSVVMQLAESLAQTFDNLASIVNNITDAKSGVSLGKEEILLHGSDVITERLGRFEFEISANSFFQTNTRACEKLYDVIARYGGLTGKETMLDLYSGTGTIPIWLSDQAAQITGIEIIDTAVADARKNAAMNKIDNCRFLAGDIREVLPNLGEIPDVIVIDPPRVGMHKDVVARVLGLGSDTIVYVSCNPATLARDLEMLASGYEVMEVQPVDMFPHTYHIESVALLKRR